MSIKILALFLKLYHPSGYVIYTSATINRFISYSLYSFFPSCMPFMSFLPPSVNWQFILHSYSKIRKLQRPIDVGGLQFLTVVQLDYTRQLSICHQTHHIQRVKLRLSYDYPYLIWVPLHFFRHKWIASSYFVFVYILALASSHFTFQLFYGLKLSTSQKAGKWIKVIY